MYFCCLHPISRFFFSFLFFAIACNCIHTALTLFARSPPLWSTSKDLSGGLAIRYLPANPLNFRSCVFTSLHFTSLQPVSYKLVSRSGDEAAFKNMVQRCASANVSIIVDAVINHMAAGSGVGTAGSSYGSRKYTSTYLKFQIQRMSGFSKLPALLSFIALFYFILLTIFGSFSISF